jgi:hypothetical protein
MILQLTDFIFGYYPKHSTPFLVAFYISFPFRLAFGTQISSFMYVGMILIFFNERHKQYDALKVMGQLILSDPIKRQRNSARA